MRQPSLMSGVIYILLGLIFTYFAIENIQENDGWGLFTYLLILLATFDLGNGVKILILYSKRKNKR